MEFYYTDERNAQIVIALLKKHRIKKVIASPGTTNVCFVASLQQDPYFEMYSAVDERSAAYMACGLSAETGETVVLSCTGATASRNYMSALTEAYYRKLPILVVTSSRRNEYIGHNMDQVTDRTVLPNDVAKLSVQLPLVHDSVSEWSCTVKANNAILELRHHGNGPVHINLETNYSVNYNTKVLPEVRSIMRYSQGDSLPVLEKENKKIGILVGAHLEWSDTLTDAVDRFCTEYNAVVICDHTSNYKGKYKAFASLTAQQKYARSVLRDLDVMIHIGDVSGASFGINVKDVWRVNPDGRLIDTFKKLKYVFEMEEEEFFRNYVNKTDGAFMQESKNTFFGEYQDEERKLRILVEKAIETIPFSNAWIASYTAKNIPDNAVLHLGIRNSLRVWDYFDTKESVLGYSNTGGFGIDGCMSSAIGASFANKEKLFFCILGDLAFFYDMNSLGNRHLGSNVRILLVNNGIGLEMKLKGSPAAIFDEDTNTYLAAAGHFGKQSPDLVKHYVQDLGMEYFAARNKEEYTELSKRFLLPEITERAMLFEVFVDREEDLEAITMLRALAGDPPKSGGLQSNVKSLIGPKGTKMIKKILGK